MFRKLNSLANKLPYGVDKLIHILGGCLISYLSVNILYALVIALIIGVGKELYDKNFDWFDMISWPIGVLLFFTIKELL